MTGVDLQAVLARMNRHFPMIMVSGHADAALRLRATSAGASGFLSKPFEDRALLDALERAMSGDAVRQDPVAR